MIIIMKKMIKKIYLLIKPVLLVLGSAIITVIGVATVQNLLDMTKKKQKEKLIKKNMNKIETMKIKIENTKKDIEEDEKILDKTITDLVNLANGKLPD